ncbi:MAG TPA: dihydrodipicolinate synthase family protein [Acidobacteriota bacterium]|jgi:4-hydroxy-tetrahydrodipicolinate synthase|uniref:Dihydrodipicolinate synthase n=1 Tax=marine metagenome TaxID=408172 RepID=A0A381MZ73_9ZZZZ|nr:dihydrodipicolinate synthase family protein [Acidobacteriota bacterium]MCS5703704.1 dihydrodipicolinate synthase family protein [Acidobacteriota bacterium]MED5559090.1 dihydrodipicolinate synthase family protein [Acidobacteriota bacterium]MEE2648491.1 dihydrodipicolinate synthase family protein [Acidobacteriota bacterium]MEE3151869.1 dihydrodipicolinate synthase family protein [Acidobacteriota bacterium]|tara:strand:- start:1631 stop:2551 length:921 start_codon:yes stop_codon:yes gene_type:complete
MPLKVNWEGVFPAIPTQFKEDLSIDIEATQKHTEALVNNGIHGIVMLGTIGEGTSLTLSEKVEVLRATVEVAGGKVPVLSGIAEFTTQGACDTVKAAGEAGVDGIMLLPAMVYKSDARETIAHFRTVANSTHLPIMCYNNPPVYRVDITPEMFKELIDVENIVVIKEASGDVRRITELFNALNDRFLIFAGLDDVALESFMLGCTGWISGLVDAFPRENRALWDAAMSGDYERALEIYRWYMPMLRFDSHPKLVQYIKLTCQELGYGHERTRPPRLPLVGEEREHVLGIVRNCIATRPQEVASAHT